MGAFVAMLEQLPPIEAQEQLRGTLSVQLGASAAFAGNDPKVKQAMRVLARATKPVQER